MKNVILKSKKTKNLSARQKEVAELMAFGFSEKEIATQLFLSVHTVHTHTRDIRKILDARSAIDVVRFFIIENPRKFGILCVVLLMNSLAMFQQDFVRVNRVVRTGRKVRVENYA